MPGPAPRIIIAARNAAGHTGAVKKVVDLACRLSALGRAVTVVATRADGALLGAAGVAVKRLRPSLLPWRRSRDRFRQDAERWIAGQRADLVIAHGDLIEQDVLHLHNCVHLASELIHGRPLPPDDELGRHHAAMLRAQRFRLLIANSQLMKDDVVARFAVDPARIAVVHPGYDPARFRRADRDRYRNAIRAAHGIARDAFLVGFITSGRFDKRGLDLLIDAVATLPGPLRDRVHLLAVGGDGDQRRYLDQAHRVGLGARFTILGKQEAIERYHHALDLFALPARLEEFGQAAQEAIVCGVPVVVSDRMGVAERLRDGDCPGVVPAGDVPALTAALARLIGDPALRQGWADVAWGRYQANTWDANWAAHEEPLYQRLLDERPARAPA